MSDLDLTAIAKWAEDTTALAERAMSGEKTGHSQGCECIECWGAWKRGAEVQEARAALPALAKGMLASVAALITEVTDLRNDLSNEMARNETYSRGIGNLTGRILELEAERDEAREWVWRLTASERVLTCAFCGEAYPPGTPACNHEALTAHVLVCAKHPMRAVEVERDRLRAALLWFADEGHYEGTYRRGAGFVDAVGLSRAREALGLPIEREDGSHPIPIADALVARKGER